MSLDTFGCDKALQQVLLLVAYCCILLKSVAVKYTFQLFAQY